ncbi:hypothetical protein NAEGRDRAFT_77779 [Naegleria gruberi]|uniref:rRNA-processing protein FYV7 n=1 Tax=Naegleria gruberi TaxID=5762 RepID=D2UYB7_NAEGR|nr:uncharacterized protein NAEGRDRAFT_77779 [Naegleria gruberi]EFC50765.1 hypothetical protein NAEGRDRAFT_77779 [Naegleria gruberi]|eukprot:XP_002683509.1 hypothetical protein NAEGRDRAFT_77779 [Naegleria gruberi strain NEG-M]
MNNLERLTESKSDIEYKRKLNKISKDKEEKKKVAYSYLKTISKMGYDFDDSIKQHKRKMEKVKEKKETKKDPFKKEREEFERKQMEKQQAIEEKNKAKEELQRKHYEREKKRKYMRRTNNRGQPVLKHQMSQILKKISDTK